MEAIQRNSGKNPGRNSREILSSNPRGGKFWVVIPAAGSGSRFARGGSAEALPKQYLRLGDRTVLEWALAPFLARQDIHRIVVVLSADDNYWPSLTVARDPRISIAPGGQQRSESVSNGLSAISPRHSIPRPAPAPDAAADDCADEDDWVLVHDAARPCLAASDLQLLMESLREDPVGGLLAVPLADTLKRGDAEDRVRQTVPREQLWRALTPQMFRYGLLLRALNAAAHAAPGAAITDESAAVELLGLRPRLVHGRADNLKITLPQDLALAERILGAASAVGAAASAAGARRLEGT